MSRDELARAVAGKRVIVCVGPGGVGKTTLAAALGLQGAGLGRKTIVLTIDPARRLASALGLSEIGNVETRVAPERLREAGIEPKGELYAMMLDLKQTWDDFIRRHAPAGKVEAILANRFYRQLSSALAGSQEYIAMQKLVELRLERDYDLLILDTSPTANALDFLDAPNRVLEFIGNERIRALATPALRAGRAGMTVLNLTGGYFVRTVSKLTGIALLEDLATFLSMLAPLNEVFRQQASRVKEILGSEQTGFVLVTSPSPLTVDESVFFHTLLMQDRMPVTAVVANRVHAGAPEDADERVLAGLGARLSAVGSTLPEPPEERLRSALEEGRALARIDGRELERLAARCAPTPVLHVPRLDEDVHDLAGLRVLDRHLFGLDGEA